MTLLSQTRSTVYIEEATERLVSYLPLNHIAAQMFDIYLAISTAATVYISDPMALKGTLPQTLQQVNPTLFIGVPRVWEKISEKISGKLDGLSGACYYGYHLLNWWTPEMVSYLIMKRLGLHKCKYRVTAAAPISQESREFFDRIGYPLCDIYGMSETTGVMSISLPETIRPGSVGKPLPGTEIKIKDGELKGEIMIKGETVFDGYYQDPDKTATSFKDGWLLTGDIGTIDADGYLHITGRVKDIIITRGGENITPTLIEDEVKRQLPLVSNVVVVGDGKKFLSALILLKMIPNSNRVAKQVTDRFNLQTSDQLVGNDQIEKYIQEGIDAANNKAVSSAQRIKKWRLITDEFSVTGGELTPTMKLKRRSIYAKYEKLIDAIYSS